LVKTTNNSKKRKKFMALINEDMEQINAGTNYRFSGTKIGKLGAAEYTLATIVEDASGSVSKYASDLERAIKTIWKSMHKSPRKDNLLLRLTQFNHELKELHGFRLLGSIQENEYDNILNIGGDTALYDGADEAIQATATYGKTLTDQNFLVNAIIVIVTDGRNNTGNLRDAAQLKRSLEAARQSENLESITVVLVGVTDDDDNLDTYLQQLVTDAGITQYVSLGKATPGKIAKLAAFVSHSISSTSAALGSGAPSQPVNMTF
jgi:hypothetical protein